MQRTYRDEIYPPKTMEVCQENLDQFFQFMYERHMIWHRRFVLKLPQSEWTNDPILKEYKYTNIYRELDRGTLWYLDHIGKKYCDTLRVKQKLDSVITDPFRTLIWETCIYRLCNKIETFEEVGFPDYNSYDYTILHNDFWEKLNKIAERGDAVMTSAHLTCPCAGGLTKVEGYIEAINSLHRMLDEICQEINTFNELSKVHGLLQIVHCIGVFIAYEVVCDLMYLKAITNSEGVPYTEDDWANPGPGAIEGIRMIFPSTRGKRAIFEKMVQLRDEQHLHFKRLDLDFPFYEKFTKGHLSLRSIEHSLCEFQKIWLQRRGYGKQRMIFNPDSHKVMIKNGDEITYKEM